MRLRFFLGFCFAVFLSSAALSATISDVESEVCQVRLSGQILKGDADVLRDLYLAKGLFEGGVHGEALCLESPGGALAEALKMGRFLHDYGIRTRLEEGASCLSACAVLFMLGTQYEDHGAGDGHNADRRMHVTARLGFHRPELRLPEGGSVANEQLERAYDLAIQTALEYIRLANLSSLRETYIPSDLIEVMMERYGEDYFYIDTVGKAGRWNIGLDGVMPPRVMDAVSAVNACNNLAVWQLRYQESYSAYDPEGQVEALTDGPLGLVLAVMGDMGQMDLHHACLLRLHADGEDDYGRVGPQLDACGFMDGEAVTIGAGRCEDLSAADPTKDRWETKLTTGGRIGAIALLPPDTRLVDAEGASRAIEARARDWQNRVREPGLVSLRLRCSGLDMPARVRGVSEFTNLRASPGFDSEVIAEVPLDARVMSLATGVQRWEMPPGASDSCRQVCDWMRPGPDGVKALNSALGGDFETVDQCFEDNQIWYHVETEGGQTGYVSGKFLRY